MCQLWTNKGLTLLLFTAVPQDAENCHNQEDGKESRKPRKDAAAVVSSPARKTKGHDPAMDRGWGETLPPEAGLEGWGWEPREGKLRWDGLGGRRAGYLLMERGKEDVGEGSYPF